MATLLDVGMPLEQRLETLGRQVQKFLRHKHIATTQTHAETSLHVMGENYVKALERRS